LCEEVKKRERIVKSREREKSRENRERRGEERRGENRRE
jgi:hypothetical protein